MRHLLLCAVVAFGCDQSTSLGPNDVELTLNTAAAAINDADLATVTALELSLSGSQNDHKRYDLTRAFMRHETVVVHLTKSTGDLTIAALARDAQGLVVALGNKKTPLMGNNPHVIDVDLEAPASGTHAPGAVSIAPSTIVQLFTKQKAPLSASVPVTWSVTGGGAGGTVDDTGLYTAPTVPGNDEVIAESPIYYGERATVTIDVFNGGVLRYAGWPAGAGTVDGVGAAARICFPRGMVFDGAGSVYFGDCGNVIRKLDVASGAVTTVAGKIENFLWADGIGVAVGFIGPW
jgi:hypothetical protein